MKWREVKLPVVQFYSHGLRSWVENLPSMELRNDQYLINVNDVD